MQACQFQPFNTIYQLYSDLIRGRLDKATDFLMMPEYLMYRLTAESTGRQVIALPIEATALGNLKIQMEATSR